MNGKPHGPPAIQFGANFLIGKKLVGKGVTPDENVSRGSIWIVATSIPSDDFF